MARRWLRTRPYPLANPHAINGGHIGSRQLTGPLSGDLHLGIGLSKPAASLEQKRVEIVARARRKRRRVVPALTPVDPCFWNIRWWSGTRRCCLRSQKCSEWLGEDAQADQGVRDPMTRR